MCGFVGFVDKLSKDEKQKSIKLMADRIIHRGPDEEGYYVDEDIALVKEWLDYGILGGWKCGCCI